MQDEEMRQRRALLQDRHPDFTIWTVKQHPVGWEWCAQSNREPVVPIYATNDQELDDALVVFKRQLRRNEERHAKALSGDD